MNTLSLTRHLLFKDLRRQWSWLALVWLLALLMPFAIRHLGNSTANLLDFGDNSDATDTLNLPPSTLATWILFLPILLVLVRLVLLDAPGRRLQFLATRPVSWTALLAEKILFIVLFLLVPVWVAKLGVMHAMRIPANALDVALILAELTIRVGALLGIAMLCSLYLRKVPVIMVALAAGYVFTRTIWAAADTFVHHLLENFGHVRNGIPLQQNWNLEACRWLMFYLAVSLSIGVAVIFQYRRKSPWKPLAVLAAGLAVSFTVWNFWPWDLTRFFPDQPLLTGPPPSPPRDAIKLTPLNTDVHFGERGTTVCNFLLEGVEPPYYAVPADFHAEATLKSGRKIRSSYGDLPENGMGGYSNALRQKMAGFAPADPDQWRNARFAVFRFQEGQYKDEDLSGASVKGELTLEIRRIIVLKTAPFRPGVEVDMPRTHYTFTKADFTPGGVVFQILSTTAPSTLRGDDNLPSSWFVDWWDNFSWIVFNRAKGQCLITTNTGAQGVDFSFFCNTVLVNGTLQLDLFDHDWTKRADWGDGAEISFFSSEPCGRITFPYEIKSIDLGH